jgi:hypothetical protein
MDRAGHASVILSPSLVLVWPIPDKFDYCTLCQQVNLLSQRRGGMGTYPGCQHSRSLFVGVSGGALARKFSRSGEWVGGGWGGGVGIRIVLSGTVGQTCSVEGCVWGQISPPNNPPDDPGHRTSLSGEHCPGGPDCPANGVCSVDRIVRWTELTGGQGCPADIDPKCALPYGTHIWVTMGCMRTSQPLPVSCARGSRSKFVCLLYS